MLSNDPMSNQEMQIQKRQETEAGVLWLACLAEPSSAQPSGVSL